MHRTCTGSRRARLPVKSPSLCSRKSAARAAIVGHSERRGYFGETNEEVNRKVRALVDAGMYAIVCVGESLAVRDAGTTEEFVCAQVRAAFAGIDAQEAQRCVVAYEPIWAIGTWSYRYPRAGSSGMPRHSSDSFRAVRGAGSRRDARAVRRLHERRQC